MVRKMLQPVKVILIVTILLLLGGIFEGLIVGAKNWREEDGLNEMRRATEQLEARLAGQLAAARLLSADAAADAPSMRVKLLRAVASNGFYNAAVYGPGGELAVLAVDGRAERRIHDDQYFQRALAGKTVLAGILLDKGGAHNPADVSHAYVVAYLPVRDGQRRIAGVLAVNMEPCGPGRPAFAGGARIGPARDCCGADSEHLQLSRVYMERSWREGERRVPWSKKIGAKVDVSSLGGVKKTYLFPSRDGDEWRIIRLIPADRLDANSLYKMLPDILIIILGLVIIGLIYRIHRQDCRHRESFQDMKMAHLLAVNQVAAGLAHEIRNPLTAMKGLMQLMKKNSAPPELKYLEIMLAEVERIEALTFQFIALARPLDSEKYEEINLAPLIADVALLMREQAAAEGIALHAVASLRAAAGEIHYGIDDSRAVRPEFIVTGNRGQLKQVLLNLLLNALEATAPGGRIDVSLRREQESVAVMVKDNGSGIDEEDIEKIGNPFYTTKEGGNGLGLSVTYAIVQHHGGRIKVESKRGAGTVFTIALPARRG